MSSFASALLALGAILAGDACSNYHIVDAPTADSSTTRRRDARTTDEPDASADPAVLAEGLCAYYEKCLQNQLIYAGYGTDCRKTELETRTKRWLGARGSAITASDIEACVAKLGATSCSDDFDSVPECQFRGTLEDGEDCNYDFQCESATCARRAGKKCGQCQAPIAAGGPCQSDADCAIDARCISNICSKNMGRVGDDCSVRECEFGLRCATGTCREPLIEQSLCEGTECDVRKGFMCYGPTGAMVCRKWQTASLGQSCANYGDATRYCIQSYCDARSDPTKQFGTCTRKLSLGQSVPAGVQCEYPLADVDGTCVDAFDASCE